MLVKMVTGGGGGSSVELKQLSYTIAASPKTFDTGIPIGDVLFCLAQLDASDGTTLVMDGNGTTITKSKYSSIDYDLTGTNLVVTDGLASAFYGHTMNIYVLVSDGTVSAS